MAASRNTASKSALWALLLGNFVIGTGVLAPAGLLLQIGAAFAVDVSTVGTLIAYGAALLFVEAPLFAFVTNKFDRRWLLTGALVVYAVGHFASAFADSFQTLLITRLLMIGGAAVFTPQAASAVSLFVPPERRAGAVAFIFLGWGLASTIAIPLASLIAAHIGWSMSYVAMGCACVIAAVAVFCTLPRDLVAPPMSFATWGKVLANGRIGLVLIVTGVFIAGQFTEYPFIAAKLKDTLHAGPEMIAVLLAVFGLAGVVGSVISSRAIDRLGAPTTVSICLGAVLLGLALWGGAGYFSGSAVIVVIGLILWGCGGGPAISAQQARLIAVDPAAASASVAMNTSILYAGQATGSLIGAFMLARGHGKFIGVVAVGLLLAALITSQVAHRRFSS